MKQYLYTFLFFLLCVHPSLAQQHTDSLPPLARHQPRLILKWAPLNLIDPHSTVQFGAEYMVGGPWSIQQEIGYGYNLDIMDSEEYRNREIWRFRTEFRKYVNDEFKPAGTGAYLAFEVLYKRMNYEKEGRLGRDCVDGDCEYSMITDYKLLKDVVGFHAKLGGQFLIENRFIVDVYVGAGLRNITVKVPGYPSTPAKSPDEEVHFIKANVTMPGNHTLVSMTGGFKLGYLIYRQKQPKWLRN